MRLSISKIKAFKSCRRMYELKYVEGLEPVQKSDALTLGSNYHELLEFLNKNGTLDGVEEDNSRELAMACAYQKYIYPKFHVVEAEKWLTYDLGADDELVGIADGIADDGHIVEYKTFGTNDSMEQYEYNLLWDEQILAYMLMTGNRKVWYVVCRKPTIRQSKNETDEEFFNRMVEWFDTDTENKIKLMEIERTDEEVEQFRKNVISMAVEMHVAENQKKHMDKYSVVTDPYYRNTCHCNVWGKRCEYSSICLHYDPNQEYIEFVKGEQYEPKKN